MTYRMQTPFERLADELDRVKTIGALAASGDCDASGVYLAIAAIRDGSSPADILPDLARYAHDGPALAERARALRLAMPSGEHGPPPPSGARAPAPKDLIDRTADAMFGPGAPNASPPRVQVEVDSAPLAGSGPGDDGDLVDRVADAMLSGSGA